MTFSEFFIGRGEMLVGRASGPLTPRLIFQPTVAVILAIRSSIRDARESRMPPVLTNPLTRRALIRHGWKDVRQVFVIALLLDVVYELIVYRWIYPLQVLLVAIVLALIPYILVRGLISRIVRRLRR